MSKKTKAADRAERAAALLREQRARERRRNLVTATIVVLVLVALVGVAVLVNALRPEPGEDAPSAGQSEYGVAIGDPDAPHEIVVYEDFLCPVCGVFEELSADRLEELADDGRVYVEYRPFNLLSQFGDYSARAASAFGVVLEESGPEVAKEYHDLLFAEQPEEGAEPYPDADWLVERAVEAGAVESEVRSGIEEGATEWSEGATAAAEDAGVDSTPTILLDGEPYLEGRTLEDLAENLIAEVE